MSDLPEGAEFWQSVKNRRKPKRVFVHLSGLECGHYHVFETTNKKSVDCYACIRLMNDQRKTGTKREGCHTHKKTQP